MALYLDPLNGGRQIVFDKAVILIGRQSDCDVVLENSRKVSRKHCCIAQVNHQYLIRDLASMNGVRVNGKRIRQEALLEVGAEVAIGDVRFVLKDSNTSSPKPPALSERKSTPTPPPVPKPVVRRPMDISQQFAVPIDDDSAGVDFAVEHSRDADDRPKHERPEAVDDDDAPDAVLIDDDSSDLLPPAN